MSAHAGFFHGHICLAHNCNEDARRDLLMTVIDVRLRVLQNIEVLRQIHSKAVNFLQNKEEPHSNCLSCSRKDTLSLLLASSEHTHKVADMR